MTEAQKLEASIMLERRLSDRIADLSADDFFLRAFLSELHEIITSTLERET